MSTKRATVALSLLLLASAGCTDAGQPSPPPDPVDSISDPSATSAPPPPDTETETATETAETTASPTTEVDGPPELPVEATEQTGSGAEAFVQHYVDALNYGAMNANSENLSDLSTGACETCEVFRGTLLSIEEQQLTSNGPILELKDSQMTSSEGGYSMASTLTQFNPDTYTQSGEVESTGSPSQDINLTFMVTWTETGWKIQSID